MEQAKRVLNTRTIKETVDQSLRAVVRQGALGDLANAARHRLRRSSSIIADAVSADGSASCIAEVERKGARRVLVAVYGSQTNLEQQLQRASIPVYEYRHNGLAGILTTLRDIGSRTGHADEAETRARDIERRLDTVRARAAGSSRVRTMPVFGREPSALRNIYVAGRKSFLHDLLMVAGGENVFADVARESVQATTELILARAPDLILEVREGPALDADTVRALTADWTRLASLTAVRTGRVRIVSGTGLVVPGPRVADAAEQFARALVAPTGER